MAMGDCGGEPRFAPITVAINRADEGRTVQIPAGNYDDLMNDGATVEGGQLDIPPRAFLVLLAQ